MGDSAKLIRFANCVVDPLARTVVRQGELQAFEPKVFDLVTYLVHHRDRVVSKQELLDAVWGRRVVVTDGVVARTVMKGRRLIGDDADAPTLIKTIHRVGYRFVAPIETDRDQSQSSRHAGRGQAESPSDSEGGPRIAVLPVVNETGRVDFAWVDLGMMAATIDSLRGASGFSVVSVQDALAVVGGTEDPLCDLHQKADKLLRALQVSDVVQATLEQREDQGLVLRYLGVGNNLHDFDGTVSGPDPIGLCRQLSAAIALALPDSGAVRGSETSVNNVFVDAVRARAMQAIAEERWDTARRLLRVLLDMSPDDIAAQLEYGRCLAWLRDPLAESALQKLLDRAQDTQDRRTLVACLQCLAIYRHSSGRSPEAETFLSRALQLAEQDNDRESELQLLLMLAGVLADVGSVAMARWMIDRATLLAQVLGNQLASARSIDLRGRLAMQGGNHAGARSDFVAAVAKCEELGLHGGAAFSLIHLAYAQATRGRIEESADYFEKALAHAQKASQPMAIGQAGLGVFYARCLRIGDMPAASELIRALRLVDRERGIATAYADLMDATLAARSGKFDVGFELLDRAESQGAKAALRVMVLRQRIRMLICIGMIDEAEDICEELKTFAIGRAHEHISGVVSHLQGLIAYAKGNISDALRHLLHSAMLRSKVELESGEPAFDAAWLCLTSGDVRRAQDLVNSLGELAVNAVENDHGPALIAQARLNFALGDNEGAVRLQERYCELAQVGDDGDAARTLAAYKNAARGAPSSLPHVGVLPSMCDIAPRLLRQPVGSSNSAAATVR